MRTKEEILGDLPKNREDWEKHYGYDNLEANLHGAMLEVAIDIRDILAENLEDIAEPIKYIANNQGGNF